MPDLCLHPFAPLCVHGGPRIESGVTKGGEARDDPFPAPACPAGACRLHRRPAAGAGRQARILYRSEEHTSELQSLMRISYAVFCLKKKKTTIKQGNT